MTEITFKQFIKLMERRGMESNDLCRQFRGKFDEPREFFNRVWQGRYADVVIPYRSVVQFYTKELRLQTILDERKRGRRRSEIIGDFQGTFSPPIG